MQALRFTRARKDRCSEAISVPFEPQFVDGP
jgi:hypothetical protein